MHASCTTVNRYVARNSRHVIFIYALSSILFRTATALLSMYWTEIAFFQEA